MFLHGHHFLGFIGIFAGIAIILIATIGIDCSGVAWFATTFLFICNTLCFVIYSLKGRSTAYVYVIWFSLFYFILLHTQFTSYLINGHLFYIDGFPEPTKYALAMAAGILCIFFSTITILHPSNSHPRVELSNARYYASSLEMYLLIIIGFLSLLPYFSDGLSGFIKMALLSRSAGGGNSIIDQSGAQSIHILFSAFLPFTMVYAIALFMLRKLTVCQRILASIILITLIIITFVSGTRTLLGFVAIPLVLFYLRKKGIRKLALVNLTIISIVFLFVLEAAVKYRQGGLSSYNNEIEYSAISGTELTSELFIIVDNYPEPILCGGGASCLLTPPAVTLFAMLTHPLPRKLFKWKYLDPSFSEYNTFRTGATGMNYGVSSNITPTIVGRYMLLYGLIGVVWIAIIFAFALRYISVSYAKSNTIIGQTLTVYLAYYCCLSIRDINMHLSVGIWLGLLLMFVLKFSENKKVFDNG